MNKTEIEESLKTELNFQKSEEETIVDLWLPIRIPTAVFANDREQITIFAKTLNYQEKLSREIEVDGKKQIEVYNNPQTPIQFICDLVRDNIKQMFVHNMAKVQAKKAENQTKASIGSLFK